MEIDGRYSWPILLDICKNIIISALFYDAIHPPEVGMSLDDIKKKKAQRPELRRGTHTTHREWTMRWSVGVELGGRGSWQKQQTLVPFSEVQTYPRTIYDDSTCNYAHVFIHVRSKIWNQVFHVPFRCFIVFTCTSILFSPTLHIMHTYYIYIHIYVHLCLNVKLIGNPYVLWSCWPRSPGAQREKEAKEAKAKAVGVPKAVRIYTYGCFWK